MIYYEREVCMMKQGILHHQIGDTFTGFMLIKEASKGVASNGKPFLTLIFRDKTGEIEAKFWDAKKEDEERYVPETIVKLNGEINQFRGKPQLKIMKIRLKQPEDNVSIEDLIEKAPIEKEELVEQITAAIFEMENPTLQRMVRAFIKKYEQDLYNYPAAVRNHHEYASGLAHHIVGMLSLAKEMISLYP